MSDATPMLPNVTIQTRSFASDAMFWLTTVFGIAVLGLALVGGYSYSQASPQSDANLYSYVMAVVALNALAGIGLLYSSRCWWKNHARKGLVATFVSVITLFTGPWLVLVLLMG